VGVFFYVAGAEGFYPLRNTGFKPGRVPCDFTKGKSKYFMSRRWRDPAS